ncbi:hypothetical protein [Microvirga sesbaniae]|uniref:hypothetical protein n=1 Tax=Microvirga sesbaniae TaxID=681392 RepID=UPI0021C77096|nr:hypothetical protein [Microvirga sp. HBU67692]
MSSSSDLPAPGNFWEFAAEEVVLYGVKLNAIAGENFALLPLSPDLRLILSVGNIDHAADRDLGPGEVAIAAIYGYAYEGHCYRFDKTRLFVFTSDPYRGGAGGLGMEAVGCGFDTVPGYTMWRIRSLDTLIELNPNFGSVEKLILEANSPGRRAPNTYNSTMQMAHRSGRLQTPSGN